jgi:large subunit ribosomal protein L4
MAVATYTASGSKSTSPAKLDKAVFTVETKNHALLKAAYVSHQANKRDNLAVTKTRGLIRGGGRKPWRQKGTGRARFGSSRNPIWRGGGITFGPTGEENYSKQLNGKAKRQAVRQALSLANDDNKLKVVEAFTAMEGKTKDMALFLKKVDAGGNILCVVDKKDESKERAALNIPKLKVSAAKYLNVVDILNADTIIISKPSLDALTDWLGKETR